MAQSTYVHNGYTFRFDDEDIVNIDDYIPQGEYNPHNVRPWLLHDHGFTLCVVFADSLQDALDEAADAGKLDRYRITNDQVADYWEVDEETGMPLLDREDKKNVDYLGNYGRAYDIESMGYIELPNPERSFCAQFNAHQEENASV